MRNKKQLGPWFVHERDNTTGAPKTDIVDDTGDPVFASCIGFDPTEEEAAAIAAAPDMLAALNAIPFPSTMGTAAEHYQRFYEWCQQHA